MLSSRLECRCKHCDHHGNRSTFYRDRPGSVPAFGDVCPSCGSDNVDVIDPEVSAQAAHATFGSYAHQAA